jgi:hypothetical protein
VDVKSHEIDVEFIKELLPAGPVVAYLDNYYLQGVVHAPHFVVALRQVGNDIEIADPFDGGVRVMPHTILKIAINSLRSHLLYSPVVVQAVRAE